MYLSFASSLSEVFIHAESDKNHTGSEKRSVESKFSLALLVLDIKKLLVRVLWSKMNCWVYGYVRLLHMRVVDPSKNMFSGNRK